VRIGGAVSAGGWRRAAHKNGASHRQAVGALLHEVVRARSTRAATAIGRSCAAVLARLGSLEHPRMPRARHGYARGAVVDEKAARRPNATPAASIPAARSISLAPRGAAHVRIAASTAAAAATAASAAATTTTTARIVAPAAPAAPTAVAAVATVAAVTAVRSGPGRDVRRERAVRRAEQLLRAAARAVAAAPEQRERRELQALGQLLVGFCGPNHSSVSGQSCHTKRFLQPELVGGVPMRCAQCTGTRSRPQQPLAVGCSSRMSSWEPRRKAQRRESSVTSAAEPEGGIFAESMRVRADGWPPDAAAALKLNPSLPARNISL